MKFIQASCVAILLTTIAVTSNTKAAHVETIVTGTFNHITKYEKYPPKGEYASSYYRIEITEGGDYISYDREDRKSVIFSNYLTTEGKTAEWKYQGYVYRLYEPSNWMRSRRRNDRATVGKKTMLMITDPQGKEIFHEEMFPERWTVDGLEVPGVYNVVN